jgi:flagellin-like protein
MKSITPVVSVILMVLITIVASVSAFFFINSSVSDLQAQGNVDTYPGADNSRLNLVSITGSKAIVRNDGTSPVTEVVMFVNNELLNYTLDTPILPGQLKEISFTAQEAGEDLEIKIIYNSGKTVTDISLAKVNTEASGFIVDYSPRVTSVSIIQNATHLNGYCLATVHNVSIDSEYYYEWLLNDESELNGSFIENHDDFNYLLSIISLADGDWKFKCQVGNGTFNSSWKESDILIVGGEEPDNNSVNCLANDSSNIWFTGTTTGNNSACCGDDLIESFSNGTNSCVNGSFYSVFLGTFDLTNANVTFNGIDAEDYSGNSVSSGDFNGDGFDDVLIGAFSADPNGVNSGASYIIFGSNNLSESIELSNANVTFNGKVSLDNAGSSVSSGDFNGDGFDDVLIGAKGADPNSDSAAGESYVVFGSADFSGVIELSNANVTLKGIDAGDYSGNSVSSGDFNGDGFDDVLIGAFSADPNSDSAAGESYVVFGSADFSGVIELSNANVTLNGIIAGDVSGFRVSSGDFNGDGFDDVLIGAMCAYSDTGESYIVFGAFDINGVFNLTDANVTLNGIDVGDRSSSSVSSGDFNGDGFDDVLIGAKQADPNSNFDAGETYIVWGNSGLSGVIELNNANVTFNGASGSDYSGYSVSSGDFNGDSIEDILIGTEWSEPLGESYIVWGNSDLSGDFNLTDTNITLNGVDAYDYSGRSMCSGDFNGDGISDVLIGAPYADPNGDSSGESYIVYITRQI